jgi:hypothetical protein
MLLRKYVTDELTVNSLLRRSKCSVASPAMLRIWISHGCVLSLVAGRPATAAAAASPVVPQGRRRAPGPRAHRQKGDGGGGGEIVQERRGKGRVSGAERPKRPRVDEGKSSRFSSVGRSSGIPTLRRRNETGVVEHVFSPKAHDGSVRIQSGVAKANIVPHWLRLALE